MNNPLEIISNIRGFISSNNPFRFPNQEEAILNALAELENTLTPQPIAEKIIGKSIVEEVVEEPVVEEPVVEEPVVEEPVVEEVVVKAPKRNARKK
jgi:hypothetical protein